MRALCTLIIGKFIDLFDFLWSIWSKGVSKISVLEKTIAGGQLGRRLVFRKNLVSLRNSRKNRFRQEMDTKKIQETSEWEQKGSQGQVTWQPDLLWSQLAALRYR